MKKVLVLLLVLVLVLMPISAIAGQPADKDKGGSGTAENVELVKKVTLKGSAAKAPRKAATAATGVLGAACAGTRYAIVVGISDYPGEANDLSYADDDAEAMCVVLHETYGFETGNIKDLIDVNATKGAIIAAITEMKKNIKPEDELVFFFSGHGAKGKADDEDRSSVDQSIVVWNDAKDGFDYLWDGQLKTVFNDFTDNRIVFIFDSCLSGGMSVLKAPNRVVNMACSANGLSYEGNWGDGHGQFTYYFAIEGMFAGLADTSWDSDTVVTVEEAFDYSKAKCQYQTPVIADMFTDDLLP